MSGVITNEELYTKKLSAYSHTPFQEIRSYGIRHNIPMIGDEGLRFLLFLLKLKKPKFILELGTAIGYSGLNMLASLPEAKLCTVEINKDHAEIARSHFENFGFSKRAEVLNLDAKEALLLLRERGRSFDFVFIDAAKAQYGEYFELCEPLFESEALVFCDNVFYQGLCCGRRSIRRNNTIRYRMDDFIHSVMENPSYETSLLNAEGGVLLLSKKGEGA